MRHTLAQHFFKSTRFGANQTSSLLDVIITHETEDIGNLNILPLLVISDPAVLSFRLSLAQQYRSSYYMISNARKALVSNTRRSNED